MRQGPLPKLRARLTYANVIATLALFIALGGTSYAVATLPRNSVGERQLKKGAVTSAKLRDGAVTRADLARDALITASRGPRGAEGPVGAPGARGTQGVQGPIGPSEVLNVRRDGVVAIPAQAGGFVTLAAVTINPGAWILEGQTKVDYNPPSPGSEFVDCDLKTAAGTGLSRGTSRVGTDSPAVYSATIPVRAAIDVDVATQVVLQCSHPSGIPAGMIATQTSLQAIRVGAVEQL